MNVSEVPGCSGCPIQQRYPSNNFVPAKPGTSLRLVVAEAPGADEAIALEPLVGGSGRRFDAMCRAAGVKRESLTLANTLSCRPPDNVYPTDPAARSYMTKSEADATVAHCYEHHLLPLLESRPWDRVDILGDKALKVLTGKTGITEQRGYVVPIPALGNRMIGMPMLHPSYLARDQSMIKPTISDLSKGLTLCPENYIPYPTLQDVKDFTATKFALDIETVMHTHKITCVGLSAKPYTGICVPFAGAFLPELKRILLNADEIITHNGLQFDMPILCEALEIEYP